MDFAISEEQTALRDLAGQILSEQLPADRLRDIEAGDDWFAPDTWGELAKADLLGLALPEAHGGTNLEPLTTFTFDCVAVGADDVVGNVDGGREVTTWITDRAIAASCA